jgi:phosphate transport system substrate-binding protein
LRKFVVLGLALAASLLATPSMAQSFSGAGSTFAYPVLQRWSEGFQRATTDAESRPIGPLFDYEASGSRAGIQRIVSGAVDFGATEMPLDAAELTKRGLIQFPFVIGGIAIVTHVAGVADGRLKLSGEVLADIYLGKVQSWADPAIKALNPDLTLPDARIAVIQRSDGSGTTFTFTGFLSAASAEWKQKLGQDLAVRWPVGTGGRGNRGVAEAVQRTPNAIGYVDLSQARSMNLAVALIRNTSGAFVAPTPTSLQTAVAGIEWGASGTFDRLLINAPGSAAYPLVAATYALMPRQQRATTSTRAATEFFRWSLREGSSIAAGLGYVPLPATVAEKVQASWVTTLGLR